MRPDELYSRFFLKASEQGELVISFPGEAEEQKRQARNLRFRLYHFRKQERKDPDSLIAAFADEISLQIKKVAEGFVLVATKEQSQAEFTKALSRALEDDDGR